MPDRNSQDARVSIVTVSERNEHDSISREEFQTWLDGFRARYADALECLRSH